MGNCLPKPKKLSAEIAPDYVDGCTILKLYGSPSGIRTSYIRIALLFKAVPLQFLASEHTTNLCSSDTPILQCGSDTVTGSNDAILCYVDAKFPNPPLLRGMGTGPSGIFYMPGLQNQSLESIVLVVTLQHKSITWHLEKLVIWAKDLRTREATTRVESSMRSLRMEVRKFGRCYSHLREVMLEHAQMEERVIFPVLEMADRGLSGAANEEHARDLPIMNGINEAIKTIGVLEAGSLVEAMFDLFNRFKTLQENCREHFEEEMELLPLLEAAGLSKEGQERMMEKCLDVMEGTHSRLFKFLIDGLSPQDAMYYLDILIRSIDKERAENMLLTLMNTWNDSPASTPQEEPSVEGF
ncbi:uncharacterized protein LOC122087651 [Macadamia integrifolia]|uniref:uncharacterized protein LOC122087651 n=1 Tax=Macadamia integrifolia TaxID=60698 RepID=UPI001C4F2CC6|nr:uncharacterized protein LOC122087651 [Macadamia integrifolia]XP_042512785.1 uncharacterized protein LOC122087651 [Macadamia integrifolia]